MADLVLTESQQAALDHLLAAVARRESASLQGVAGSGKTTLTGILIERLLQQGKALMVAAPTHKALDVLRARVPNSVECKTLASLLGLKPVQRGRWIDFQPDFKQAEKRGQLRGYDVLLADEMSMTSDQMGADLVKLCATTGTVLVAIGDASQLPPCSPPPGPGEDESSYVPAMAECFINPPGGVARLTEVVRHQGPVLELATAIRQCTTKTEVDACWPTQDKRDASSKVFVYEWPNAWFHAAKQILCDPRWEQQPDCCRIVVWTNRECARLTQELRTAKLGATAAEGWRSGEILQNGDAIQQPGKSMAPPLAPSTCEWRVVDAEPYRLKLDLGEAKWQTPKRKEPRSFEIGCDIQVQKLTLDPLAPGSRQQRIEVFAPIPGDPTWANRIAELRQQIAKIETGPARTKAWSAWHSLRSHCCDLRAAQVLSVHRAQGSGFRHLFAGADLSWANTRESVALHYTAITRASEVLHVLRREVGQ